MIDSVDIVIVLPDFNLGGSQKVVFMLIKGWVLQGRRVALITLTDGSEDYIPLPEGCRRIALCLSGRSRGVLSAILSNCKRIIRLRRCLADLGAPVVLSFLTTTNILTVLASRGLACRVVISERSDPSKINLGSLWIFLLKKTYRYADTVITNNKGILEWLSAWVPTSKLAVVVNPILPILQNATPQRLILVVAQLREEKGIDILIRAFLQIQDMFPNWQMGIVGDGPESIKLKSLAKESPNIVFYGRQLDVTKYYQQASIYVQPSRHEGMPNAMLEAMSAGLPVIVSDASPGPLEYIKHHVTGLVFSSEDSAVLAKRLVELIEDAVLRLRLGAAAKQLLKQNSLDAVMHAWESYLFGCSRQNFAKE